LIDYIKKYGCIEKVIASLDKTKYTVPDNFPYVEIREYFKKPDSIQPEEVEVFSSFSRSLLPLYP
jgi:flap endonuclease-1